MGRRSARQGCSALFPSGFHLDPPPGSGTFATTDSRTKNFICTLSRGLQIEVNSPSFSREPVTKDNASNAILFD